MYDAGPRTIKSPVVCLPPVCGTADVFFKQVMHLASKGYRVISVSTSLVAIVTVYFGILQVEYPVFWSVDEFCEGFLKLIDFLELTKVIIYNFKYNIL